MPCLRFFNSREEEYRVLVPFVRDVLERGEKIVHTIDPERRAEHLERLAAVGIDVTTLLQDGRLELRTWSDTHLLDGYFDQHRTLHHWRNSAAEPVLRAAPEVFTGAQRTTRSGENADPSVP
jgi:MEDS: MEthanogen/methylotroph, DcmR Sensory domain